MIDMTEDEARQEAIRRWGPRGAIHLRSPTALGSGRLKAGRLARYRCLVGNMDLGVQCTELGQGDTWREAFADARGITRAPRLG